MLKKHRRITGLFMVFVMVFVLIAPMTTLAKDTSTTKPSMEEKQVLFSGKGNEVSAALVNDLKTYNINITDKTVIEVVYTNKSRNETVLTVKNVNDGKVEFNYLLALDKEGVVKNVSPGSNSRAEEVHGKEFDPIGGDSVVVVWTVRYNIVRDGVFPRYQPKYAQAILHNNINASVSGAKVKYVCRGCECLLPNFTNITGSAGNYFEHIMQMNLADPNRYYTATNAYNYTNRVINTDDGGHFVKVEFTVGTREYAEEFDLP